MTAQPRFRIHSKYATRLLLLCTLLGLGLPASAATPTDPKLDAEAARLLRKHNCSACHQLERKVVGPSFKAVAERYAGNEDGIDLLTQSIRAGGAGKWGPIPMPPSPRIDDDELATMARWILSR